VRHGQSTWNHEHRIQGQLDPPLSDDGRRQATRLGRRLAGRPLAGFYSSDLKRAFQTSQLIGDQLRPSAAPPQPAQPAGIVPTPMPELREIYLGEW
jgi:broad specificity phosphatase PhoE